MENSSVCIWPNCAIFDTIWNHRMPSFNMRRLFRCNFQPLGVNTLDARSRSTDFAQTSLRRQKSVDRRHGMSTPAPEVGRLTARYINARGRPTLFSNAYWHRNARVIEIQTRQQLKNNFVHETQQIFMNNFCIWTPSGQRTS